MADLSKIAVLLSQQKEKLRELEEVTDAMAGATADEITAAMEKREEIFKPLTEINEELKRAAKKDGQLRQALNNEGNRSEVGAPYDEIYDASMESRAIANRIIRNEGVARGAIEAQTERLRKQIEELNSAGGSVADKYQKSLQMGINRQLGTDKDELI